MQDQMKSSPTFICFVELQYTQYLGFTVQKIFRRLYDVAN